MKPIAVKLAINLYLNWIESMQPVLTLSHTADWSVAQLSLTLYLPLKQCSRIKSKKISVWGIVEVVLYARSFCVPFVLLMANVRK